MSQLPDLLEPTLLPQVHFPGSHGSAKLIVFQPGNDRWIQTTLHHGQTHC
jgi:hypothetical protein